MRPIQDYLFIQKVRFGERLEVKMDIAPGVEKEPLPLLTLQPLVENALVHGVEPSERPGRLRLAARREDGRLIIDINDNGVGMSPQRLTEVQSDDPHGPALGLSNVRLRLRHFFGPQASLRIESQPGRGTRVRLSIPLSA